jgi:chondroitin 4-sulfotransferase 11
VLGGLVETKDPTQVHASSVHGHLRRLMKLLQDYSEEEIKFRLKHYVKFIFTRHPFERLLSAYNDKFNNSHEFPSIYNKRLGSTIVKRYRPNETKEVIAKGGCTFHEFVSWQLEHSQDFYDEHWRQMYKLCEPCAIKYDVIGNYDTFDEDTDYILREVGVDHKIQFPDRSVYNKNPKTHNLVRDVFSQFSQKELDNLYDIYADDFHLFGYKLDDVYSS